MPRGRSPTSIVRVTSSVSVSITLSVSSFSLEIHISPAAAGALSSALAVQIVARRFMAVVMACLSLCGLSGGSAGKTGAAAFRRVEAQRVKLGTLVQEAFERRDGRQRAGMHQRDGLAQLPVPGAKGERAALEPAEIEGVRQHVRAQAVGIGGAATRHALADGADGGPGGVILALHLAARVILEPALKLRRAPLLDHRRPRHRAQPLGPR